MHASRAAVLTAGLLFATYGSPEGRVQHQQHDSAQTGDPTLDCFFSQLEDAGPHLKMTPRRPASPEDRERAEEIVRTLRRSLEKYKDHEAALKDGYKVFLPRVPLPEHHFTHYGIALREAFDFDPSRPSSLLYRSVGRGDYELRGAMFTAPLGVTLTELDRRVPLGVARWHLHTNVCLPPAGQGAKMLGHKPRFGFHPEASIQTEAECLQEDGRFFAAIFGWMMHVYPFEEDPQAIWRHPGHHDHALPQP